MMKKASLFAAVLAAFSLASCGEDDNTPEPVNEEELITTVRLTFTDTATQQTQSFSWQDLDGDGANAPTKDTIVLEDSTAYDLTVEFLNETENPAEDVTAEVRAEAEDHQVFFQTSPAGLDLSINYDDSDANGNPLGVENESFTGEISNGTLTVVLRHEPDKNANGVSNGEIANAGGETDVEVAFDVVIQ